MPHPNTGPEGQDLGTRLRQARQGRGWSLADAAEASSRRFRPSTLAAYERGERRVAVDVLYELARLYDIPISALCPPTTDETDVGQMVALQINQLPSPHRSLVASLVEQMLTDVTTGRQRGRQAQPAEPTSGPTSSSA